MRIQVPEKVKASRILSGRLASDSSFGMQGAFIFKTQSKELLVISGIGFEWEHVSVSTSNRCPNWQEMCFIKNLFWDPNETVMQIHPPEENYINNHPYCLHLWKPLQAQIPMPPEILVGIKGGHDNGSL